MADPVARLVGETYEEYRTRRTAEHRADEKRHQAASDAPLGETFRVVANVVGEQYEHSLVRTCLRRESDGKTFIVGPKGELIRYPKPRKAN